MYSPPALHLSVYIYFDIQYVQDMTFLSCDMCTECGNNDGKEVSQMVIVFDFSRNFNGSVNDP